MLLYHRYLLQTVWEPFKDGYERVRPSVCDTATPVLGQSHLECPPTRSPRARKTTAPRHAPVRNSVMSM